MKLTQQLVTRYAKYRALKNLLDKWLKLRRDFILKALAAAPCPDRGPYLLVLNDDVDERINWREEFVRFLRNEGRSEDEIGLRLGEIEQRPRESSQRIECKINANYRQPFPIRLPK